MDKLVLEQNKQRFVIGSSQEVAEFFHQQEELGLTEAMLITPGYDKQTRFQSFERLAKNYYRKEMRNVRGFKRINTLAQKEREQGLTSEEQALRVDLRQEYLRTIREQFNKTLMGVTIYDPTGEDVTPEKLKEEQQKYFD